MGMGGWFWIQAHYGYCAPYYISSISDHQASQIPEVGDPCSKAQIFCFLLCLYDIINHT